MISTAAMMLFPAAVRRPPLVDAVGLVTDLDEVTEALAEADIDIDMPDGMPDAMPEAIPAIDEAPSACF